MKIIPYILLFILSLSLFVNSYSPNQFEPSFSYISSTINPNTSINLSSNILVIINTLILIVVKWELCGSQVFILDNATVSDLWGGISLNSETLDADSMIFQKHVEFTTISDLHSENMCIVFLTVNTTTPVYYVSMAQFSGGNVGVY